MTTLVALLALAAGPGDLETDLDLPLTLSAPEPQAADKVNLVWWLGGRLGYWEGFDADDGGFMIGAFVRTNILPWLSAEASLDFHKEEYSNNVDVTMIPILATALFHPWKFDKWIPYGLAGFGFYHVNVDAPGDDDTDVELGFHLGVGVEWRVTETILLDSSLRFGFVDGSFGDDLDFWNFNVGVAFKLSK
jgi:opacity protein-like surface antigen